jgi:hypothetical protein
MLEGTRVRVGEPFWVVTGCPVTHGDVTNQQRRTQLTRDPVE